MKIVVILRLEEQKRVINRFFSTDVSEQIASINVSRIKGVFRARA